MGLERTVDVAVIGAGLAGLAAAGQLHRDGLEVVVVEARDRVGGRTLNHPIGDGKIVEVGGQWVGPGQDRVLALIDELGLHTFPTYTAGRHLFEHRGKLRRYRGRIPLIASAALLEAFIGLRRLDRMSRAVPAEAPWSAARAGQWDAETVESWMRHNLRSDIARQAITMVCKAVWAADPADVSLLHLLAYLNAGGGVDALIETDGGAQQTRIVGGSQRIALALAEQLDERVLLHTPVRTIEQTNGSVIVHGDDTRILARRVIVAMSPALAGRLVYCPALPADRDQLTQRMPNGSVIKTMAVYNTPFWRANGLSGQVTAATGPVKVTFDNSPPDGNPGVLLAFLEGGDARRLGRYPLAERRDIVISSLTRFFGPDAATPIDYIEKDWSADEWTRGCYGAFTPPNTWTEYGPALRAPVGRIHWAGAETATIWMGYMDGAIRSGERAAAEITALLGETRPATVASAGRTR
ncbi:flavin monoamine oxidase family protein [Nocardia sp. CA-129566]|uniref:flavin monoamine oxidase family protein n=1 Tax=Nocardia sp. CA-129566 TaxID=3239976 RepID=UPI003D95D53E